MHVAKGSPMPLESSTQKRVTISDVARYAGVSNATVSAVLNNKGTVKDSTRRRVLEAIEKLNYRPSGAARRRLQPTLHRTIGLVVKEVDNPYFADIFLGAREVANRHGYTVLITSSESDFASEHRIVDLLADKDIDGLIINPLLEERADLSHLFELKRRNIPFVLIENVLGLQANIVDVDNVAASKEATRYLIEGGHERIIHFAGPRYSLHTEERIEGFRRAFSETNLIFREDMIVYAGARLKDGYEKGLAYFQEHHDDPPTAVTCYNDLVAIGLMRALHQLGIKVPDQVSIVGYDDIAIAEYLPIPLTTVRVPKTEMGAKAAELLIRQVEGANGRGGSETVERIFLQAQLIVRRSTRPLK